MPPWVFALLPQGPDQAINHLYPCGSIPASLAIYESELSCSERLPPPSSKLAQLSVRSLLSGPRLPVCTIIAYHRQLSSTYQPGNFVADGKDKFTVSIPPSNPNPSHPPPLFEPVAPYQFSNITQLLIKKLTTQGNPQPCNRTPQVCPPSQHPCLRQFPYCTAASVTITTGLSTN